MVRFFVAIIILTLVLVDLIPSEADNQNNNKCGKNELSVDCLEPCQPSCSWPDRPKCPTFTCSKGCRCATGYLRANNDTSSSCIKCKLTKTCGKNEVLSSCANPCQPTCSWQKRPPCPTFTCSAGCVCQKSFYRANNNTSSSCIKCSKI